MKHQGIDYYEFSLLLNIVDFQINLIDFYRKFVVLQKF